MSTEQICPRCGNVVSFSPADDGTRQTCNPLSCDAWTFTHRLTKEGPKPIRRDGRADLGVAE